MSPLSSSSEIISLLNKDLCQGRMESWKAYSVLKEGHMYMLIYDCDDDLHLEQVKYFRKMRKHSRLKENTPSCTPLSNRQISHNLLPEPGLHLPTTQCILRVHSTKCVDSCLRKSDELLFLIWCGTWQSHLLLMLE